MTGIEPYHAKACPSRRGGKCNRRKCSFRAKVRGERSRRFPTRAEAEEWQRQRRSQAHDHRLAGPKPMTTLNAAWALWLDMARRSVLHSRSGAPYKPVTLRDYNEAMRNRVLPDYGGNPLADVTHEGLKRLVRDWRGQGLSATAIRNAINPMRALYRDAEEVVDGWRGDNPTTGLKLPRVRSRRTADRIPTPDQSAALVEHAPERDRAIWATACYAGLRRGELRALRRGDIDLWAGKVKVRRAWDRVEHEIDPKTEAGKRDVPVFAALRPLLDRHLAGMADVSPDALVFGTSTGGPFDPGDVSKRAAKAWAEKCEAFTLHECRHGFASVCVEADVNAKRIQTWMGHSSITTTFDLYGRLLDRGETEAVEQIDAFLAVGPPVGPRGADEGVSGRSTTERPTSDDPAAKPR